MGERQDPPTGIPEPHPGEDPHRGEHNELGFFSQDEEAAKDESPGPATGEDRTDEP